MKSRLTNTQAKAIATMVLEHFNQHAALFINTDEYIKPMFEAANWEGIKQNQTIRVQAYKDKVIQIATKLRQEIGANALSDEVWQQAKAEYCNLLQLHSQSEWAKAYFSSVTTEILKCHYFDNPFTFSKTHSLTEQLATPSSIFALSSTHSSDLKPSAQYIVLF